MPERLVIADTSPLFYLNQVGRLDLLRNLYGTIVIPPAVRAELEAGRRAKVEVPNFAALPWIEMRSVQSRALIPAIVDLGAGEAEVIGPGLEYPGSLLILDDSLARRVAALNRLSYTGTMGLLIKAKQGGYLKAVRPLMEEMRGCGLWVSEELVAMVLAQAGEL
ncbi:MAG: DUF3368 domain-containing protein [Candidatus Tectomicrobia bacterium]|uniref:DUF3368 domain-containing protein n=1 Tax=Tectimicrobiota bacterium TaxID=2528274 RepID=A0A932M1A0_UNCTE|nr:DUF3368 domain-containing protein [Candidatus Tectomicrobia bacterium]